MPISGSGSVSFSQIRTEYVGGSAAVSASQLYRGGTNIRQKAADNQGQNQAANVPTSGVITADNFRGTAKGFKYTYNADATDQDISDLFGADYSVDYPKEVVIASGVELGATSLAEEALEADNGLTGTLKVTNQGTLTGRGGGAGQAGGDAFEANVTCTFINEGTLRAGGGGGADGGAGGRGGTGGQGRYNSTSSAWTPYYANLNNYRLSISGYSNNNANLRWAGQTIANGLNYNASSYGNYGFGTQFWTGGGTGEDDPPAKARRVRRYQTTTNTHYTNGGAGGLGGAGGSGGSGAGYQQTAGSGGSGSSGAGGAGGGTNAGTGGTGGTGGAGGAGGAFGAAGSAGSAGATGNTGGGGNHNNGAGGQGGSAAGSAGASGKYLRGSSNVTFTNNGTVQGAII